MSITRENLIAKVAEYSGLGIVGTVSATGSTSTITDARKLASYATDIAEGSAVYLKFATTPGTAVISFTAGATIGYTGYFASHRVGDTIVVTGSSTNDGIYTIATVATDAITVTGTILTAGAATGITLTTYQQSWVTNFDKTTGIVTVSPAIKANAVGDRYEIWFLPVESRGHVEEAVDRALTGRCYYWQLQPLTILPNGDCEAAATDTNTPSTWAGTNATLTRTIHSFPDVFGGRFHMSVLSTAANGYASQTISVDENRTYSIAIMMQNLGATAAVSTSDVVLYDASNSASITPGGDTLSLAESPTSANPGPWRLLIATLTTPDNCWRLSVRLRATVNTGSTYVAWVALWPQDTYALPLPARITRTGHVGRIFRGYEKLSGDFPQSWDLEEITAAAIRGEGMGLSVVFPGAMGSSGPYFYEERTFYESLNSDVGTGTSGEVRGTTDCDTEYAGWMATYELLDAITNRKVLSDGPDAAASYEAATNRAANRANQKAKDVVSSPRLVIRRP